MKDQLIDLSKRIEAENETFYSLSKAEQRVVIAEDCILRILNEQIRPSKQRFFWNLDNLQDDFGDRSIKEVINCEDAPICEVCAKGGLFLSVVGRVNEMTFKEVSTSNEISSASHGKLLEFFTARQLAYIEYAFEGKQHIEYDEDENAIDFTDEDEIAAYSFYQRFDYSKDRLVAICQNIILNNGEFVL